MKEKTEKVLSDSFLSDIIIDRVFKQLKNIEVEVKAPIKTQNDADFKNGIPPKISLFLDNYIKK